MRELLVNILIEEIVNYRLCFKIVQRDSLGYIIFGQNNHPKFNSTDRYNPPKELKQRTIPTRKIWPCLQCEEYTHANLLRYRKLPSIHKIKKIFLSLFVKSVWTQPLETIKFLNNIFPIEGTKITFVPNLKKKILLCRTCGDKHLKVISWLKEYHNPLKGLKNYSDYKLKIG